MKVNVSLEKRCSMFQIFFKMIKLFGDKNEKAVCIKLFLQPAAATITLFHRIFLVGIERSLISAVPFLFDDVKNTLIAVHMNNTKFFSSLQVSSRLTTSMPSEARTAKSFINFVNRRALNKFSYQWGKHFSELRSSSHTGHAGHLWNWCGILSHKSLQTITNARYFSNDKKHFNRGEPFLAPENYGPAEIVTESNLHFHDP